MGQTLENSSFDPKKTAFMAKNLLENREKNFVKNPIFKMKNLNPAYDRVNIDPQVENLNKVEFERPNYLFKSRMNYEDYQNMVQRIEW
jgi:hypothetical protein